MKLKQKILEFIKKAYEDNEGDKPASETDTMTDKDRLAIYMKVHATNRDFYALLWANRGE